MPSSVTDFYNTQNKPAAKLAAVETLSENGVYCMKTIAGAVCLAVVSLLCSASVYSQDSKSSLSDLSWLAGCWELSRPEKGLLITEQWMKPMGGMMIGAGRTVKNGRVADYEYLRIVEDTDGIYYVAKPTGNKDETKFKLIKSSRGELMFENPAHDFPQRVTYRLNGERLDARIEGTINGKSRGTDFPYTRVSCR